ncbi:MAG: hypothetical protein Q8Q73_16205 [Stagnimonas sp.]|nr:hypothetical protein [Stagnimonas sp.]
MRDPRNQRALTAIWLGLLFGPAAVGAGLGLLPPGSFRPVLAATALQGLVILGLALGASSLALLKRYRALESSGDELALRQALLSGAGAADLSMIFGTAYFALGGERPVFWAMCAASMVFIAMFRPRGG